MTTELLIHPSSEIAAYQPFYADLSRLEEDNKKQVFNYESVKGNKEARSHVYKLRQTKGALESVRKEAKADYLRLGRAVDAEAEQIKIRIEAMIAVHQVKLDEIERREADRIAAIVARVDAVNTIGDFHSDSKSISSSIAQLQSVIIDDSWEEFTVSVAQAKDMRIAGLNAALAEALKREAEAEELEKLRKDAVERAQKDRDDAIAKAAADRATADAKLQAEQEAAKARQAIEAAELSAKQEREAAERRELELKLQTEQAERRRIEAEQKAEQDKKDALIKAEQEIQKAVQDEKDRIAKMAKMEAEATAKREANKKHLAKINNAALDALVAGGVDASAAKLAITLIAFDKVPFVVINY